MRLGPTFGIVAGEQPQLVHRLSAISDSAYCGKPIVVLSNRAERSKLLVCRRCGAIDESRREGMPEFGDIT